MIRRKRSSYKPEKISKTLTRDSIVERQEMLKALIPVKISDIEKALDEVKKSNNQYYIDDVIKAADNLRDLNRSIQEIGYVLQIPQEKKTKTPGI